MHLRNIHASCGVSLLAITCVHLLWPCTCAGRATAASDGKIPYTQRRLATHTPSLLSTFHLPQSTS